MYSVSTQSTWEKTVQKTENNQKQTVLKAMKTTKIQFITALFMLLLGTSSCLDEMFIEGNGISRTETRDAEGFNQISSSGDFTVTVMPGNFYSVEIIAESNLLPYISTNVDGKTLKIRTIGIHSLRQTEPIEIFITTPVLNGLTLSGSGLIETGSFMLSLIHI
eukprot:TRINITY_DN23954_c0_g1_i1.p2 TRINITY_DN23954_c0_g1~~TRINITY_DN23954_c0_g1_i1.p2  ORF type:complete len:163 (-),score=11.44 TRINITY_DN23954_c0_g1_i1:97-585(-)